VRKRVLSPFLCRELLYDYVTGHLDEDRKKAVEEAIKETPELEDELKAIKQGQEYAKLLSKTEISEPVSESISLELSWLQKIATVIGWTKWPAPVRFGIEAALIALVVAQVFSWVSYKLESRKSGTEYTLAKLERESQPIERDFELTAKENTPTPSPEPKAKKPEASAAKEKARPTSTPTSTPQQTAIAAAQATPSEKAESGFVYRAFMFSERVEEITEEIAAELKNIGGKKAGEVPLGWRRKDGSYFHFTVPEENYSKVESILNKHGSVKIIKDKHPRVMKKGTIRFIFWLEKTKKDDSEKEKQES
jgi:cell division septation protein DedD